VISICASPNERNEFLYLRLCGRGSWCTSAQEHVQELLQVDVDTSLIRLSRSYRTSSAEEVVEDVLKAGWLRSLCADRSGSGDRSRFGS
jgi:hypothetical protein